MFANRRNRRDRKLAQWRINDPTNIITVLTLVLLATHHPRRRLLVPTPSPRGFAPNLEGLRRPSCSPTRDRAPLASRLTATRAARRRHSSPIRVRPHPPAQQPGNHLTKVTLLSSPGSPWATLPGGAAAPGASVHQMTEDLAPPTGPSAARGGPRPERDKSVSSPERTAIAPRPCRGPLLPPSADQHRPPDEQSGDHAAPSTTSKAETPTTEVLDALEKELNGKFVNPDDTEERP